jgi:hypothetical protein
MVRRSRSCCLFDHSNSMLSILSCVGFRPDINISFARFKAENAIDIVAISLPSCASRRRWATLLPHELPLLSLLVRQCARVVGCQKRPHFLHIEDDVLIDEFSQDIRATIADLQWHIAVS